jgi:predicted phage-related endonuclease
MKDITSTEIGALFNLSPYITAFELWNRKKEGIIVEIEENERMTWGIRLQDKIAEGIAEDQKWQVRRMDEYISIPELRIGASFDFSIESTQGETNEIEPWPKGLLEIKNVDSLQYKKGWIVDGDNIEAPMHIELQCQHQLLVSKRAFLYIGVLIGGNKVVLVKRLPDPEIHKAILDKVSEFWKSIEANQPPSPDFARDAKFISKLYGYSEVGKVYSAEGDNEITTLAKRYKELGDAIKDCDKERDAIKSQLLMKIGDAEKVIGDQFSISAGIVGPTEVSYHREAYRLFKINWRKK